MHNKVSMPAPRINRNQLFLGQTPSWLNQIEIYFSIVQRKALTPNDFDSLSALRQRIIGFQKHYEKIAKPFEWKFTRSDLGALLNKMKLAA